MNGLLDEAVVDVLDEKTKEVRTVDRMKHAEIVEAPLVRFGEAEIEGAVAALAVSVLGRDDEAAEAAEAVDGGAFGHEELVYGRKRAVTSGISHVAD